MRKSFWIYLKRKTVKTSLMQKRMLMKTQIVMNTEEHHLQGYPKPTLSSCKLSVQILLRSRRFRLFAGWNHAIRVHTQNCYNVIQHPMDM